MRVALLALICINLFANSEILSKQKLKTLNLKSQKNIIDSKKLEQSWINPIILSISKNKNAVDTSNENESTRFIISLSQDIFRSGGIYYAIEYAKANKKLNTTILKLEKNSLLATAYKIILNIKKTELNIQKLRLQIANADIDIKRKKERYLSGLLDISFLNNAIINRNKLKNSLTDLESILSELKNNFKDISDIAYSDDIAFDIHPISKEEYLKNNLLLKQKQDEIKVKKYIKKMTASNFLPKISIEANYIKEDTNYKQNSMFLTNKDQDYYNYGIKVVMPLNINSSKEIQSAKLSHLIAQNELNEKKKEESNFYNTINEKLKNYKKKIKTAKEDVELFNTLLSQTIEQRDSGLKTDDDVAIMQNSKKQSELDIKIYQIETKLLYNLLMAKITQ